MTTQRHLEGQLQHVTEGIISGVIRNSLAGHLGKCTILDLRNNLFIFLSENVENYLIYVNTDADFVETFEKFKYDMVRAKLQGLPIRKTTYLMQLP